MHAKVWIQKSILKDAQLKMKLKYETIIKVKLKIQATKSHRGILFNVSETCNFISYLCSRRDIGHPISSYCLSYRQL